MERTRNKERDVSADFTGMLEVGERIVLRDAEIGLRRRLLLTNRRLIAFQGEGVINPKYAIIQQCPIDQIDDAWADVDRLKQCWFKIRTKDSQEWECRFDARSSLLDMVGPQLGEDTALVRQVVITNRWVNAINRLIAV
jgi:hypothetical protein